ncbi:MAG: Amidophosphoribosyltransferase precursor [Firmicutes bacterium ADurb.Bin300]|nr:MAG: Amidophosphoribosyltransferase precursor [Firmicutes bacterium ADurb.Bin300]
MSSLYEECGVFGIASSKREDVAASVNYGLFALQHRGQESCGIVVNDDGVFKSYKDSGIVNDVFTKEVIKSLEGGNMAIGHVRYGTAENGERVNAQPIVVNHIKGKLSLANNGSLTNYFRLRDELELEGALFHTGSDAEIIAHIITKERLNSPSIEDAVSRSLDRLHGSYSFVLMSPSKLIAVRDKNGFKPLCFGKTEDGAYIVASESCALDATGAVLIRDVDPGEIIIFENGNIRSIRDSCKKCKPSPCIFEYIYFARSDSVIDGCSVHLARQRAGSFLALEHPVQADVVIGVPDSGIDAAIGYSRQSGIPYGLGFIKNRYIARTFISPGQKSREDKVKIKLNTISETVRGKRVVLIDDSIVRGTTSGRIVKLLRDAGAVEVHMRVTAPPFIYTCYYGTNIESRDSLIATKYSCEQIADIIGVDSLGFLSVEHVPLISDNTSGRSFCLGCFTGKYPTDVPDESYLKEMKGRYDKKLSERTKK